MGIFARTNGLPAEAASAQAGVPPFDQFDKLMAGRLKALSEVEGQAAALRTPV